MSSADISVFSPKICNFFYIKKYRYRMYFNKQFPILLAFVEALKVSLIDIVLILMMSAKLTTLGLLKVKVF